MIVVGAALLVSQMGHGAGCCSDEPSVLGPATETTCPPTNTTLTYNNFGKMFMESYCTKCHDENKSGEQRQGAPKYHDLDTLIGIMRVADHIDQTAASGPSATNTSMPPKGNPAPSLEERQMLAEWIACGMPE